MQKVKLVIGDWSGDGHTHFEQFVYESNKTVEEIQQAYKDSCLLTGISFNHNQDYTGLKLSWEHPEDKLRKIAVEYESNFIPKLAEVELLKHGLDVWDGFDRSSFKEEDEVEFEDVEHFVELLVSFIKLSLPDLTLEEAAFKRAEIQDIPAINGWWSGNLNVQFGYGLFE